MPKIATVQPSPRVLAARRNGALGGKARAAKYSAVQRREWSSKGGQVLQDTYGSEFKKHIGRMRKHVGRYRTPVAQTKLAKIKRPTKVAS